MNIPKALCYSILCAMPMVHGMDALYKGIDPRSISLHDAAHKNDLHYFHTHLEENDPKVNEKFLNQTPLMIAIIRGHFESVEELVGVHGADLRCADSQGKTALHWAVSKNLQNPKDRKKIALHLMKAYSDINLIDPVSDMGMTPFHQAILDGQTSLALSLMSFGADKEAKDKVGVTPLKYAETTLKIEQTKLKTEQAKLEKAKTLQDMLKRNATESNKEKIQAAAIKIKLNIQETQENIREIEKNIRKYTKLVDCISTALAGTQKLPRKALHNPDAKEESPETAAAKKTKMLRWLLRAQQDLNSSNSLSE